MSAIFTSGSANGQSAQPQIKTLAESLQARRRQQAKTATAKRPGMEAAYLNYSVDRSTDAVRKQTDAKEYADRIVLLATMENKAPNKSAAETAYINTKSEAEREQLIAAADRRLAAILLARRSAQLSSQQTTTNGVSTANTQTQPTQNQVQQPQQPAPRQQPVLSQRAGVQPSVQPATTHLVVVRPTQQPAPARPATGPQRIFRTAGTPVAPIQLRQTQPQPRTQPQVGNATIAVNGATVTGTTVTGSRNTANNAQNGSTFNTQRLNIGPGVVLEVTSNDGLNMITQIISELLSEGSDTDVEIPTIVRSLITSLATQLRIARQATQPAIQPQLTGHSRRIFRTAGTPAPAQQPARPAAIQQQQPAFTTPSTNGAQNVQSSIPFQMQRFNIEQGLILEISSYTGLAYIFELIGQAIDSMDQEDINESSSVDLGVYGFIQGLRSLTRGISMLDQQAQSNPAISTMMQQLLQQQAMPVQQPQGQGALTLTQQPQVAIQPQVIQRPQVAQQPQVVVPTVTAPLVTPQFQQAAANNTGTRPQPQQTTPASLQQVPVQGPQNRQQVAPAQPQSQAQPQPQAVRPAPAPARGSVPR